MDTSSSVSDEQLRRVVLDLLRSSEDVLHDWVRDYLRYEVDLRAQFGELLRDERRRALEDVLTCTPGDVPLQDESPLAREISRLRLRLSQMVSDAVAREAMAAYSRDRVAWGDWTRAFAIDGTRPAEAPLPAIAAFVTEQAARIVPPELLAHPFDECVARDPHPLPATGDREGYHGDRHLDYWLDGLAERGRIVSLVRRHGLELGPGSAVLDFGCATGRVLRHFVYQDEGLDVWGTDIRRSHVDWMHRHFPGDLKAFQCTIVPHLPLADDSLDLVYALSVFTHIDEFEFSWLAELRRVLKPGGIAYLTIHSDMTWADMNPGWGVYRHLLEAAGSIHDHDVTPEFLAGPMPGERVVLRWRHETVNNTNVFASCDYVRRTWGRFLDVLDIVQQGSGYQDVVVLRKRAG